MHFENSTTEMIGDGLTLYINLIFLVLVSEKLYSILFLVVAICCAVHLDGIF